MSDILTPEQASGVHPRITIKLPPQELVTIPPPDAEFPMTIELFDGRLVLERRQHYAHCGSWFGGVHSLRNRYRWAKTYSGLCIKIETYMTTRWRDTEDGRKGDGYMRTWEGAVGSKVIRNDSRDFVQFTIEARVRSLGKLLRGISGTKGGARP